MRTMMLACVVFGIAPLAAAQKIDTAAEVLEKFGLFGHVAPDCSTPVGPGHVRYVALDDGTVRVDSFVAGGASLGMLISEAKLLNAREVELKTMNRATKQKFTSIWLKNVNEFRLKSTMTEDGRYIIRDSEGTTNRVYRWVSRCDAGAGPKLPAAPVKPAPSAPAKPQTTGPQP